MNTLPNNANQNENLLRAITPQIVDFLFKLFYEESDNDKYELAYGPSPPTPNELRRLVFCDKKLIVCRCLPLIVNILHLSLPDKRQVDLSVVLEKCMLALELVKRADIKLELIKSYLNMISECSDKAALKIVLASGRFFVCLIDQCQSISANVARGRGSPKFLHTFLLLSLTLIKNLIYSSDTVKVNEEELFDLKCLFKLDQY